MPQFCQWNHNFQMKIKKVKQCSLIKVNYFSSDTKYKNKTNQVLEPLPSRKQFWILCLYTCSTAYCILQGAQLATLSWPLLNHLLSSFSPWPSCYLTLRKFAWRCPVFQTFSRWKLIHLQIQYPHLGLLVRVEVFAHKFSSPRFLFGLGLPLLTRAML